MKEVFLMTAGNLSAKYGAVLAEQGLVPETHLRRTNGYDGGHTK
jgi:hypothetical protein